VDGAEFTGNTILFPQKWIFRILQETRAEGFPPCRNVLVKGNRFVFRRAQIQTDVNIGPGTEPGTFRFEGNHWFAEDRPNASTPTLPSAEKGGVYGTDPRPGAGASPGAPRSARRHAIDPQTPQGLQAFFRHARDPLPLVHAHRGGPARGFPEHCVASCEHTLRHTLAATWP
jgi:hypothetical protein